MFRFDGVRFLLVFALILGAGATGCGEGSKGGGDDQCGGAGEVCCAASVCDAGLSCQLERCQGGSIACGALDQPCCAGAAACAGSLACVGDVCRPPPALTTTRTICAPGGRLELVGATLTVPRGALNSCRRLTFTRTELAGPDDYTLHSPVFTLEPADVEFAVPVTLDIEAAGAPAEATAFWTRGGGTSGFAQLPSAFAGGTVSAALPRAGQGFVAGRNHLLVCADGETLTLPGVTLTIPSGALSTCTDLNLTRSAVTPEGYTTRSPVFGVAPAGVAFAVPATLSITTSDTSADSTAFWTRAQGSGFEPLAGTTGDGVVTAPIGRTGQGFLAGRDYLLVCAAGGTLSLPGVSLTIPEGALSGCTMLQLTSEDSTPAVYVPYSPVIRIAPADLTLAVPATLSLAYSGDAELATMFWSRAGTTGYERLPTPPASGALTATLSRLGSGFVADGMNFTDLPDRSCVVTRMIDGRTTPESAVALFYTVDDCWGRPIPGLVTADFQVREDGAAISPAEASATILRQNGVAIFASLVIDMSASTLPHLGDVIASARAFVTDLQVTKQLPVKIDIQVFAGGASLTQVQPPTRDTQALLASLDALANPDNPLLPTDRNSTNLNGAVQEGLAHLAAVEAEFQRQNDGGAFTIGYLVLFTDGRDTAQRVTHDVAVSAVAHSSDHVVAAGMQSVEYDPEALAELAPAGVITAASAPQLSTAFVALANRMEQQIQRFYLLGYCSPKRSAVDATYPVSVGVVGATQPSSATYTFNARGFTGACSANFFATMCDGLQCGGIGCGYCDDRVASCNATTSQCVPF